MAFVGAGFDEPSELLIGYVYQGLLLSTTGLVFLWIMIHVIIHFIGIFGWDIAEGTICRTPNKSGRPN